MPLQLTMISFKNYKHFEYFILLANMISNQLPINKEK